MDITPWKNKSHMLKILAFFVLITQLSACIAPISRNLGATDYRVHRDQDVDTDINLTNDTTWLSKYRKADSKSIIKEGESISITLQSGFIRDFSERLERLTSALQFTKVRGEIAILAKVYEANKDSKITFGDDFENGARLIYYSDDVRSGGQPLNFSDMPLYGPITYNGGPLIIELAILELDFQETAQLKGMLSQLASLGATLMPPSSPEIKLLEQIGSQLLSGDQDDREFSYKFVLSPAIGSQSVKSPVLEVGNYVLVNQKQSQTPRFQKINAKAIKPYEDLKWGNYRYDSGNGILYQKDNKSKNKQPDNTYLVLQIEKGRKTVELGLYDDFETFKSKVLEEENKNQGLNLTNLDNALKEFSEGVKSKAIDAQIENELHQAKLIISEYKNETKPLVKNLIGTRLYNILIEKNGFPLNGGGSGIAKDISNLQKQSLLEEIYEIVKDPDTFPINFTKTDFPNTTTFISLLN